VASFASLLRGVTAMVQGGQLGEESSEESDGKTRHEEARREARCREASDGQEGREASRGQACFGEEGREASCRQACCREACSREARDPARRPRPTAHRVGRFEVVINGDYHAPPELAGRDPTTGKTHRPIPSSPSNQRAWLAI